MVTQKEYAEFQENYDKAHREGRVTETDYAHFQNENDRTHPLNSDGSPAYITEEEYGRFQDDYDRAHREGKVTQTDYALFQSEYDRTHHTEHNVSRGRKTVRERESRSVPYSMRPSRPQGTYVGKPMTAEEIAERDRAQEEAWRDFWRRQGVLSPEEQEKLRLENEAKKEQERKLEAERREREAEARKKREEHQRRVSLARRKNKEQDKLAQGCRSPLQKILVQNAYGGTEARKERDELIEKDDATKKMVRGFPKKFYGG